MKREEKNSNYQFINVKVKPNLLMFKLHTEGSVYVITHLR